MIIYKCIIIDDDPFAIEGLTKFIDLIPNLTVIKSYTDPIQAMLDLVSKEIVDLILLDINMPKISGIELSREIRKQTHKLVFTTAYTKYGYEAFEVEADAYLLKPYSLSKFTSTIVKLFPEEPVSSVTNTSANDYFFVEIVRNLKTG